MNPPEHDVRQSLDRLAAAAKGGRELAFMEVCGTHTTAAFRCGLPSVLPRHVKLISGPGCPVCVTAQQDIDLLVEAAGRQGVTLCTYGDMIRVPGRRGSLQEARGRGARVHVVYSAMDAVALAQAHVDRQVVFAAVGFETTAPATAAAVQAARRRGLTNFTVLNSHKRIVPAMQALLERGAKMKDGLGIDGFVCPGHVSVIIGARAYLPLARDYAAPCVISGFEPWQMISALARLAELAQSGRAEVINEYPEVVSPDGNRAAQKLLDEVFQPAETRWRGLGLIAQSAWVLRPAWREFDAQVRFGLTPPEDCEPKACLCGKVISGLALPTDCSLFGRSCTPLQPVGPCMVSSEGTCAAWFKYSWRQAPHRPLPILAGASP